MSGLIGTAVRQRLEPRARLAALNRSDVPGVATVRADIADFDAIRPAFEGQDTVIHLAAKVGDGSTWEELLETNVIGTRNVFEAARLAGCKRIVFASSGATVAGWEHEEPYRALVEGRYDDVAADWLRIRHDMVTRPKGPLREHQDLGRGPREVLRGRASISPRSCCASATSMPKTGR